jgi:hypothetical protein
MGDACGARNVQPRSGWRHIADRAIDAAAVELNRSGLEYPLSRRCTSLHPATLKSNSKNRVNVCTKIRQGLGNDLVTQSEWRLLAIGEASGEIPQIDIAQVRIKVSSLSVSRRIRLNYRGANNAPVLCAPTSLPQRLNATFFSVRCSSHTVSSVDCRIVDFFFLAFLPGIRNSTPI